MRAAIALCVLLAGTALGAGLDGRRLRVDDGRLVDQRGREVTLRGVNARVEGLFDVTFDDGRLPLEAIPTFDKGVAYRRPRPVPRTACWAASIRREHPKSELTTTAGAISFAAERSVARAGRALG